MLSIRRSSLLSLSASRLLSSSVNSSGKIGLGSMGSKIVLNMQRDGQQLCVDSNSAAVDKVVAEAAQA